VGPSGRAASGAAAPTRPRRERRESLLSTLAGVPVSRPGPEADRRPRGRAVRRTFG